jgi:L-lactate dehydrogenase complex protein LldG
MPPSSREAILSTIRRSLGVGGGELTRKGVVEERLDRAPKGIVPERAQGDAAHRLRTFRDMVAVSQASLDDVGTADEVPQAIATFLRDHNIAPAIRRGADPRLAAMPWQRTTLEVAAGPSDGNDLTAVSHALAAVAETGTVMMASGEDNPSTLNFLPDTHIVVVDAKDVVADYEGAWNRVRRAYGKGSMPRTVNWITGPSRSADIEQTLLLGAHGPRRLHVVLVGG